jgi:hypothetical protein
MLDRAGTLSARALKGLRASLKGVACLVAFVIGISLSIPMQALEAGSIDAIQPKDYIRLHYKPKEALCLIKLYGKESAFRVDAIGNLSSPTKSYVYGIPQLKNPIIKDLSANSQIDYGMKYVAHRYSTPCRAWSHWLKKGWH